MPEDNTVPPTMQKPSNRLPHSLTSLIVHLC